MTDKFGTWLTIVSNIGVLIGLFFLIVEIEQNSAIARTTEYRENIQDIAEYKYVTGTDQELWGLQNALLQGNPQDIDDEEMERIAYLNNILLSSYENAFYAWKNGIIDDLQWSRFESGACPNLIARDRLPSIGSGISLLYLTSEFEEHLRNACS